MRAGARTSSATRMMKTGSSVLSCTASSAPSESSVRRAARSALSRVARLPNRLTGVSANRRLCRDMSAARELGYEPQADAAASYAHDVHGEIHPLQVPQQQTCLNSFGNGDAGFPPFPDPLRRPAHWRPAGRGGSIPCGICLFQWRARIRCFMESLGVRRDRGSLARGRAVSRAASRQNSSRARASGAHRARNRQSETSPANPE